MELQGASTDMTKVERGGIGIAPSFETGATSPSSHDDDLDQSTLGPAEYNTPRKNIVASAPSFVEQIKVDEKIRHLTHILDQELEPLSPPPTALSSASSSSACQRPQKPRKTLQRTSQRATIV